jgi:hypothetical protein
MSNSSFFKMLTRGGMMFALMTISIWSGLPAVMLLMHQQASLRIDFLGFTNNASKHGSAEQF